MTYVSTCLADGAGGLWELGEASGTTTTDQAGNANASTGGSSPTWGLTGIPGGGGATAASSNLAGLVLTAASVAAQQIADTAMTVECWVKRSATQGATQRITGANNSSGAQFGWNASNQLQVGKIGVANIVASTVAVTDTTTWHHLVWTKAGATNHLYVDGTDVTGTVTNQTLTTAAGWKLFQDASNNNNPPTNMGLAMVAVYKLVLTPTQVANHYSLGSSSGATDSFTVTLAGTSSLTAAVAEYQRFTATIAGTSSLTAAVTELHRFTVSLAGTSSLTAAVTALQRFTVGLAGTSTLTAPVTPYKRVTVSLAGTSSLTATAGEYRRFTVTIAGGSALTATVGHKIPVVVTLAGSSTLSSVFGQGFPAGRTGLVNGAHRGLIGQPGRGHIARDHEGVLA